MTRKTRISASDFIQGWRRIIWQRRFERAAEKMNRVSFLCPWVQLIHVPSNMHLLQKKKKTEILGMPFYKTPLCLPSLFYSWKYSGKPRVPFRFKPQGVHFPFCSSNDCVTGQGTHFLNQSDDSVSHLQSIALTSFKQIEYCSFVCIVVIIYASKWHWDLMSKQGVWLIQGGKSLLKRKGWFLAGI